jgi:16S rRNA (cytidine1402-2'-O)-methyltransferase
MQLKNKGTLYVIATPIGNLKDISLRAIETLKQVDRIAAEDTRTAEVLLNHYGIKKPIFSLHHLNENAKVRAVLAYLEAGETLALISDAGTPLISDPGYVVVKEAIEAGFTVIPIPGACAAIAALSVSGLPTDRFIFEGFLPAKKSACQQRLTELVEESRTLVFYEAPHRLLATLQLLRTIYEDREMVIARELTKLHETIYRDTAQNLWQYLTDHPDQIRGEIVLLIKGATTSLPKKMVSGAEVLQILLAELPLKQAAHLASKITGERKNELYDLGLQKNKPELE